MLPSSKAPSLWELGLGDLSLAAHPDSFHLVNHWRINKIKNTTIDWCATKRASPHSCVGQCSCCTLHYSKYDSVPICLWAASGWGQQGHSVLVLLICAFCTSQQRHHNLIHVSIEDMSFIGPLGKIKGYGKKIIILSHFKTVLFHPPHTET